MLKQNGLNPCPQKREFKNRLRTGFLRRVSAIAATVAISLHAGSSDAGNMSLTLNGFSVPVEIFSYNFSASKVPAASGTGATIASFGSVNFAASESAATPLVLAKLTSVQHLTSAQLQILSPITAQPISDWTFTDAVVRSVAIGHSSTSNGPPTTSFSLSYSRVAYRVFATDGSIAQQTCWDVAANVAC